MAKISIDSPLKVESIRCETPTISIKSIPEEDVDDEDLLSARPSGYSWQRLQETIRKESKAQGILDDEDDEDADATESSDSESAKSSFSMLISAVLCK